MTDLNERANRDLTFFLIAFAYSRMIRSERLALLAAASDIGGSRRQPSEPEPEPMSVVQGPSGLRLVVDNMGRVR